jgi:hypothetical protein
MARWETKTLQTTWKELIPLWKTRNDERHGIDKESRDMAMRGVLHHELEEIYARQHQYPQRVQRLLRTSHKIHIQETVTKIADWLDAYGDFGDNVSSGTLLAYQVAPSWFRRVVGRANRRESRRQP